MENSPPDQLVVDSVANVRDRFGVEGLRDLVELATRELRRTEATLSQLGEVAREVEATPAAAPAEAPGADTQTWQAFVDEGQADERR